jgi:hypothetical protein
MKLAHQIQRRPGPKAGLMNESGLSGCGGTVNQAMKSDLQNPRSANLCNTASIFHVSNLILFILNNSHPITLSLNPIINEMMNALILNLNSELNEKIKAVTLCLKGTLKQGRTA